MKPLNIKKSTTSFIQFKSSYSNFSFALDDGGSSEKYDDEIEKFMLTTDFDVHSYSLNMRAESSQKFVEQLVSKPFFERGFIFDYGSNIAELYLLNKRCSDDVTYVEFDESSYWIKLNKESLEKFIEAINNKRFNDVTLTIFLDERIIEQTTALWEYPKIANPLVISDFAITY